MPLKYDDNGLIPAIIQDNESGEILMFAWMNDDSVRRTLADKQAWFWSRSRKELWHKGATSGSTLDVNEVRYDCDADVLLVKVHANGPACHTGERSCFFRELESPETAVQV
jgi:phosphoribosyl-ATP pyrophosphohydrolase/phosphoribosyl-AMP cyclohydrolase